MQWVIDHWEVFVVPVASLLASIVNGWIRSQQEKGEAVPKWLLWIAGVLVNVPAMNFDKAKQLTLGGRGPSQSPR